MINSKLQIERFPFAGNPNLKAWNAADELLVSMIEDLKRQEPAIFGDRFGYLTLHLQEFNPLAIINYNSQLAALKYHAEKSGISAIRQPSNLMQAPHSTLWHTGIIHIPKSNDLFEVYIRRFAENAHQDAVLLCAFMTRHFTTAWLDMLSIYFDDVVQTKAVKKARVIVCRSVIKKPEEILKLSYYNYHGKTYGQFPGVFSKSHIDAATAFLLEYLIPENDESELLDIGCGNGIIGISLKKRFPWINVSGTDDNMMAVASARLNDESCDWRWVYNLDTYENESFDIIVTNPPFHLEYETDPALAWNLLQQASLKLRKGGRIVVVFNRHLNYSTQLIKWFSNCRKLAENEKFSILECRK